MILRSFPLPPSSNQLYASFRGRLIKSKAGRDYDNQVRVYGMTNRKLIESVKSEMLKIGPYFHIDTKFVFLKSRLIGQKGQIKALDASNRLKATHDALAALLRTDDRLFVSGAFSKAWCDHKSQESVIITISAATLSHFEAES